MKALIVHGVLAVVGLGAAYRAYTDDGEDEGEREDAVTVFECAPERVARVKLVDETRSVELTATPDGTKRVYAFATQRKIGTEDKRDAFAGQRSPVDEYLKQVAPLRALRALGKPKGKELEELELDDAKTELTVVCGGSEHVFRVGGTAFGTGDRYVQAKSGEVFLVPAAVVRDLESAEFRMMQRDLVDVTMTDVEHLVVQAEGKEKKLLQRNRRTPEQAEWVDAAEPDRRNETFGNWLERVKQLRAQEYLDAGARPGSDLEGASAPVTVAKLRYQDARGQELADVELARVETPSRTYYARSSATHAWVRVPSSVAQQVEDDLRQMLGLAAVPRPTPAPDATPNAPTDAVAQPPAPGHAGGGAPGIPAESVAPGGHGSTAPSHPHGAPSNPHGASSPHAPPALPPGHP